MPPTVSVIMLAYNRPQFMRQAIESVLNQTFRDFEFLILDNGSKGDEVYNIAKEYADKDPRVHVSRVADNLGVHLGRSKLLHQTQACYIATIEDDDFWALNKLEAQVNFLREHPDVGVYSCSYALIDEKGESHKDKAKILNESIHPPTRDIKDMPLISDNYLGSGQMFRRNALFAVGGWRTYFVTADDVDLFFRFQENYGYASTSKKLLNYRSMIKKSAERKSDWAQLSAHKKVILYKTVAEISALYRRKQKADPIDANPVIEDLLTKGFFSLIEMLSDREYHKRSRKITKHLLRQHDYTRLNQFMKAYGALPNKQAKLYINLCVWSVWYGRLGYWFKF